jgi:hypothetical protein
MASRREERERLRQARLEREQEQAGAQKRKLMIGYVVAGLVGLAVLVGIVVVVAAGGGGGGSNDAAHINQSSGSTNGVPVDDRTGTEPAAAKVSNLRAAAKEAGCELRLGLPAEGKEHVSPGTKVKYKTNPATSGNHAEPPFQQADGAYSETPDMLEVIHSLEHGRVSIQYSPDLPEPDQLAIKGLYDTMYGGTLLFPNPDMPYEVAATAWTNLLGCPTYEGAATLDAIRAFGKATWGKFGGEPANAFTITGPTPAQQ